VEKSITKKRLKATDKRINEMLLMQIKKKKNIKNKKAFIFLKNTKNSYKTQKIIHNFNFIIWQ